MAYETITDPSNPFNTTNLSHEVRALLRYVEDAKADMAAAFVVTCTTDHPKLSNAGNVSRHRQLGTGGEGLAIDGRMRTRGTSTNLHLPFFNAFAKVGHQLHELIYANAPYNIRGGVKVKPYAVADHRDHVHVSVNRGVLVQYPNPRPVPQKPQSRTLVVHLHPEDKTMTHDHIEPLDQQGCAQWFTQIPWTKFQSVNACHPTRPYVEGYRPGVDAQPVEDDGNICVVITGGAPGGEARVMLTVAA